MIETTEYFHRIPTIKEIVGEIKDARKKRRRIAIIVSAKNDEKRLQHFLKRLSEQTYKDFDVIIIYGEEDRFLEEYGDKLTIMHIRIKKDPGFA